MSEQSFAHELLDVVDDDDRVVGQARRADVHRNGQRYRLAVVICRNSAGQIYVHRRSSNLDVFPDMYDMMVAGHVKAGESYEDAARREVAEELGIVGVEPQLLFKCHYDDEQLPSWATVFQLLWDGPIQHQAEEIGWGAFMDEAELIRRLDDGSFTPDGVEAFRRYLAYKTSDEPQ